jgi:hypothetical protein
MKIGKKTKKSSKTKTGGGINNINNSNNSNSSNSRLNTIRQTYANKYSQYQLLDYIYDKNTKKLIKVWDHKTNDPNSITAELPGIHNYFVIQGDKKILIGKFIR